MLTSYINMVQIYMVQTFGKLTFAKTKKLTLLLYY